MIEIVKNTGEREEFDKDKLKDSLLRARTTTILANEITEEITKDLYDGISTNEIYKKAFEILNKKEKQSAAMYSLRRSILDLGPSGFPFEEYIAQIFQKKGYKTSIGALLKGKCVEHEVDVVAQNDNELYVIEVKFHNQLGVKSDTKVALYIKARFDDLENEEFEFDNKKQKMSRGILITNTKFTNNAIKYSECVNKFDLISWDYPKKGNLYDLIFETGLQPTTCIEELSKKEKQTLIENGIVTCSALKNNVEVMKNIGVDDSKIKDIVENIDTICAI